MVLDHSGLLQYPWVDYHANPENFVKFAYLIAGCNLDHMGFDPSIFYEEAANGTFERFINVTTIKPPPLLQGDKAVTEIETPSFHEHKFRITKISHREQAVRGAGSFWWDAEEVGTKDVVEVTIKDYWRNLDRQHEAEFLREAERKGVEGVIRLRIAQYEPLDPQEKITTANARGLLIEDMRSKDGTPFIDMIHTRIVTERQVPITQFQNGLQLIHALTDALSGKYSACPPLPPTHSDIHSASLVARGLEAPTPQYQHLYDSSWKAGKSKREKRLTWRPVDVGPYPKRSQRHPCRAGYSCCTLNVVTVDNFQY